MKIGSTFARSNARTHSPAQSKSLQSAQKSKTVRTTIYQRGFACFMAMVLAVSMTPSVAFADTSSSAAGNITSASAAGQIANGADEKAAVEKAATENETLETAATVSSNVSVANSGEEGTASEKSVAEGTGSENANLTTLGANPEITVNFELVGIDAKGNDEVWSNNSQTVAAGSTADVLIEQVLNACNLTHTSSTTQYGYYLSDITSSDGRVLGWDSTTGKYWQLFVNGKASDVGASSVTLSAGDSIVLYYSAYGDTLDSIGKATFISSVKIIGPNATGADITWAPQTEVKITAEENMTAAMLTKKVLEQYGMTCDAGMWTISSSTSGGTLPNGETSLGSSQDSQGNWHWWVFYINGAYSNEYASTYLVQPGDEIAWYFSDGSAAVLPESDVDVNPDADHPDVDVQFNGFANGGEGAVTGGNTPIASTDKAWATSLLTDDERDLGSSLSVSTPLVINSKLYIVSGSTYYDPNNNWAATSSLARLQLIDPATGSIEKTIPLATTMDSTCRPICADGIIIIPLTGGYLQAVSATTFETLWVSDAFASQNLSSLTVGDGYVYLATVDAFDTSYNASAGTLRRVNLLTGAVSGQYKNDTAGYYWAGGVMVGDYYVVADDAGNIAVFSADLSRKVSSVAVSSNIRSTLAVDVDTIYAVSNDGVFYEFTLDSTGTLSKMGAVSFAGYSTSTPTICGGYAFVGGSDNYKGVLACIDLSSLSVTKITQADDVLIPYEIKSTPLVSIRDGKTYVYFTANGADGPWPNYTSGGGVYVYRLGDDQAHALYAPGEGFAQYCLASVVSDGAGNLYYTNDSGYLFKIAAQEIIVPDDSDSEDEKPEIVVPENNTSGHSGTSKSAAASSSTADDTTVTTHDEVATVSAGSDNGVSLASAKSATQQNAAGSNLPYILLAIGVAGLVAAIIWFVVAKRRKSDE